MDHKTEKVEVKFANGATAYFETSAVGGEEEVAFDIRSFEGVLDAIEGVSQSVLAAVGKVKPSKASVEFGVEVAMESGQLTALIVKGEGKANLKITLEWEADEGEKTKGK
jgi:hypothetical protein